MEAVRKSMAEISCKRARFPWSVSVARHRHQCRRAMVSLQKQTSWRCLITTSSVLVSHGLSLYHIIYLQIFTVHIRTNMSQTVVHASKTPMSSPSHRIVLGLRCGVQVGPHMSKAISGYSTCRQLMSKKLWMWTLELMAFKKKLYRDQPKTITSLLLKTFTRWTPCPTRVFQQESLLDPTRGGWWCPCPWRPQETMGRWNYKLLARFFSIIYG